MLEIWGSYFHWPKPPDDAQPFSACNFLLTATKEVVFPTFQGQVIGLSKVIGTSGVFFSAKHMTFEGGVVPYDSLGLLFFQKIVVTL